MTSSQKAAPLQPVVSFEQQVDVETPEQVVLSYTLAGVGARAAAAIVDFFAITAIIAGVFFLLITLAKEAPDAGTPRSEGGSWAVALVFLFMFALQWGYYVLFEALWDGQTPGKRLLHIRVVQDGGYSVSFGASAIRNIARIIDMQPALLYGVGIISASLAKSGKRLGDMMAGTFVVQERIDESPILMPAEVRPADSAVPAMASLTASEYELLERFLGRSASLSPVRLASLADQLSVSLSAHMPNEPLPMLDRLRLLYARERDARSRGLAARGATGAARERHAMVARSSKRWSGFAAALRDAQRRGLRKMSETEVSDFVAQYREIATDLARLKTASKNRESEAVFSLSRLVAGGHNLLYRQRALTGNAIVRFLAVNVPSEIRRSWRYIGCAALLLFGPMAITYQAVVDNPQLAESLLPPGMIDRANEGVARAKNGDRTYVEVKDFMRPVMATGIIANNIQVTYAVFVAGITFGLLTIYMLVGNGISIGAAAGLYASKGIFGQIGEFVLSHSVFELSAICIAGGGGLLIARALLLPGVYTRREALVVYGRRAIRLIAACTLLLIVAGTLEGMISPRTDISIHVKVGIAITCAVVLFVYVVLGGRGMRATDEEQFAYSEARALSSR